MGIRAVTRSVSTWCYLLTSSLFPFRVRWTLVSPSARQRRIISDGKSNIIARKGSRSKIINTFIILLWKSWHLWINPVSKAFSLKQKADEHVLDELQDLARGTCNRDRHLCKAKVDNPENNRVNAGSSLVSNLTKKKIPTWHIFKIKNQQASQLLLGTFTYEVLPCFAFTDLWQLCLHVKSLQHGDVVVHKVALKNAGTSEEWYIFEMLTWTSSTPALAWDCPSKKREGW